MDTSCRKSEELVFQHKGGPEGTFELVRNDYVSRKLAKEAETYIHRWGIWLDLQMSQSRLQARLRKET